MTFLADTRRADAAPAEPRCAGLGQQGRVPSVTDDLALRAGDLRGRFRAQGETRSRADMLIAATAFVHRLILVTRNEDGFEGCGLTVLNPFA